MQSRNTLNWSESVATRVSRILLWVLMSTCLAFTAAQVASPDILRGLLGNIVKAVQHLTDALNPILQTLGCPELVKYDATLFDRFPGAGSGL